MTSPGQHLERFITWVTHPGEEVSNAQRISRYLYDVCRFGARRLSEIKAAQLSAALTYRTIFSLVPVLVLTLVVLRAFYGTEGIKDGLNSLMDYTGLSEIAIPASEPVPPVAGAKPQAAAATQSAPNAGTQASALPANNELGEWIEQFVERAVMRVESVNATLVTLIFLVVLIYGALSLLIQIESSFNTVCRAKTGRRLTMRLTNYWTLITLGSLALGASITLAATFEEWVNGLPTWMTWAAQPIRFAAAVGLTWLLLLFAYTQMPNTRVRLRSAAVGAIIAALLWEGLKSGLAEFIGSFTSGQVAIYGSLALLPLFLLWTYATWLLVLFGLAVSHTVQTLSLERLREREAAERATVVDPGMGLAILSRVAEGFRAGKPSETEDVADAVSLDEYTTEQILEHLARSGFVHRTAGGADDEGAFVLAMPPDQIKLDEVLKAMYAMTKSPSDETGGGLLESIRTRQLEALRGSTIATPTTA
ncbi:MAG: YhjD/YihY/BrkB family envelope integrity protein [Planctomycetota bacterium]